MLKPAAIAAALALVTAAGAASAGVTLGPAVAPLGAGFVSLAWKASESTPMEVTLTAPGRDPRVVQSTIVQGTHRVRVSGLAPGVEYSYRVGGAMGRFMAPPDATQEVRFGVFGDTRQGDAVHRQIVERLAALRPDFYLMTGDILIDGAPDEAWRHFFAMEKPLMETTAFTSVRGNHDGESSAFGALVTPQSASADDQRSYGSMTLGPAHFVMVDTEQSVSEGSAQHRWLEQDLSANQNKPLFVMLHKPLFSTGVHGGSSSVQRSLAPLFQRYGVDLVFQGHDHMYERSEPINGVTYVVTGGGGAVLYGAAAADWVVVRETANHYMTVDASAGRVRVLAKRLDGSQLDSFEIDPRANNGGRYATTQHLPSPGGGGCAMVFFKPGAYRREAAGASAGLFGPLAGLLAVRARRRRKAARRRG